METELYAAFPEENDAAYEDYAGYQFFVVSLRGAAGWIRNPVRTAPSMTQVTGICATKF